MRQLEIRNPRTQTPLKLVIYSGFENQNQLLSKIERYTNLKKDSFVLIIFQNEVYGVASDGLDRGIIMGKDQVWYYKDRILQQTIWRYFKQPYTMYPMMKLKPYKAQIAQDLRSLDPNLQILGWKESSFQPLPNVSYVDGYLNLLGQTFYDVFFSKLNYKEELFPYFNILYLEGCFKSGVVGINPFQNKVLMSNGNIAKARFF